MADDQIAWLMRLVEAVDVSIARLRELDDPWQARLVDDLQRFRDDLSARVAATEERRDAEPS